MRNRTRVIAAAAVTAALAAGGTAGALAATAGAKPGGHATTKPASGRCTTDSDLAARLGVSNTRLDQAATAVKTSLSKASATPAEDQFYVMLARGLGVSQARVQQAYAAMKPCESKSGSGPAAKSGHNSGASAAGQRRLEAAFSAAVARELHVTPARVSAALQSMFAAGRAETSSPAFAAAARSLGVTTGQLRDAMAHAKQSLAGGA
jgi:hypothetical protein